jgi:hypothetical protein
MRHPDRHLVVIMGSKGVSDRLFCKGQSAEPAYKVGRSYAHNVPSFAKKNRRPRYRRRAANRSVFSFGNLSYFCKTLNRRRKSV